MHLKVKGKKTLIAILLTLCLFLSVGAFAASDQDKTKADQASFVGSETCKGCHDEVSKSFADNPHAKLAPVSYTHLDVYKRQVLHHFVLLQNLVEDCQRPAAIQHVVLADDLKPVHHRLLLEDVLVVRNAQPDPDAEFGVVVEAIGGHIVSFCVRRKSMRGPLAPALARCAPWN